MCKPDGIFSWQISLFFKVKDGTILKPEVQVHHVVGYLNFRNLRYQKGVYWRKTYTQKYEGTVFEDWKGFFEFQVICNLMNHYFWEYREFRFVWNSYDKCASMDQAVPC